MNSCVQFGKALEFSSVWEEGDTRNTETLICDVKEVEGDEDLPPWASSDSAAAPEKSFSTLKRKVIFSDILREVKVREETLQSAVARLGGGTRGLQMLLEHVNHWAVKSQDEEKILWWRSGERLCILAWHQRHNGTTTLKSAQLLGMEMVSTRSGVLVVQARL